MKLLFAKVLATCEASGGKLALLADFNKKKF